MHYLHKYKGLSILGLFLTNLPTSGLLQASPLISIGDNAEVYFDGSSTARWTSNVFLSDENEEEDFLYILSPGFEFNIGSDASNADFTVLTRYDIIRYHDLTDLDVELLHVKLRGAYKSSRLELTVSASYDEQKSNSGDMQIIDQLLESSLTAGEVRGEYEYSPKISFGTGATYTETEYTGEFEGQLTDQVRKSLPLNIYYELTPKLDLSFGYTFTDSEIGATTNVRTASAADALANPLLISLGDNIESFRDSYEREDHFFNIGARGSLLPKLTGYIKVGYRQRRGSNFGTRETNLDTTTLITSPTINYVKETTMGVDADMYWIMTPKLSTRFGLSRDFGVGSDGAPTKENSVSLSSNLSLSNNWTGSANLMYTQRDYTRRDRKDDKYSAGIRIFYLPNRFWQFSGGYTYNDSESSGINSGNSYDAHTVEFNATLRY